MWQATYTKIDRNGLDPEVRVYVTYSNDTDDQTYQLAYDMLPDQVNSSDFQALIQNQIDILNAKDAALSVAQPNKLLQTDVVMTPQPEPVSVNIVK